MPTYELMVLIRQLPRPDLAATLKRTAEAIYKEGGLLRKIENFGFKETPYKMSKNGLPYRKAHYFLFQYIAPPKSVNNLKEYYTRDVDVIKPNIFKTRDIFQDVNETFKCTLQEELQPPAYRKEVQEMIEIAKKDEKPKFKYNSGMDYYPFQK